MNFTNDQVTLETLPQFKSVEQISIDGRFAGIRLGVVLLIYTILSVFVLIPLQLIPDVRAFTFSPLGFTVSAALIIFAALLACYVYAFTKSIQYAIRDHDLILSSGIFWNKEVIQPLKRVQHVELSQGPIDKFFGLANIKLFSAGTGLSTFRIPGLTGSVADQIKQYVLDYKEAGKAAKSNPEQMPE